MRKIIVGPGKECAATAAGAEGRGLDGRSGRRQGQRDGGYVQSMESRR